MEKRFWSKVTIGEKDECWEWCGTIASRGYGQLSIHNKLYRAHRVAYELYHKKSITEGMIICHSCDNRKCCNPHHLREGTPQDNSNDMKERGRSCIAEKNAMYVSLPIKELEAHRNNGLSYNSIAKIYKVDKKTIWNKLNKKKSLTELECIH